MKRLSVIGLLAVISGTAYSQVIIMDQIGANPADQAGLGIYASQDFEAAFNAYDIGAIDDFMSPGLPVTMVEAVMGCWNPVANHFPAVAGYRVEFYSSTAAAAASLTGDLGSVLVAPGAVTVNNAPWGGAADYWRSLVSIPIPNLALPAGTVWVGVIPQLNFSGGGQVGVSASNYAAGFPNNGNAGQANPGAGFGFTYQTISPPTNLAYRITAVPEPATLLALGVGIAALAARRRRK